MKEDERNRVPKDIDATAVAVGPKGRFLAIGTAEGLIRIAEATSGKTLRLLSGHSGLVSCSDVLAGRPAAGVRRRRPCALVRVGDGDGDATSRLGGAQRRRPALGRLFHRTVGRC